MPKLYGITEIFLSIQGEGVRVGTRAVFVRFAGCNLKCRVATHGFDCDTEFPVREKLDAIQIRKRVEDLGGPDVSVILTGGEPGLQVNQELLWQLADDFVAIETNGTVDLSGLALDWITLSPKVRGSKLMQRQANEVKFVLKAGDPLPDTRGISAKHFLISPAWGKAGPITENIDWCTKLVMENDEWKMTLQTHKLLGLE